MTTPILQRANSSAHLERFRRFLSDPHLVLWRGVFAFATLDGVVLLDEEPERSLRGFLDRGGKIDWIIGIDAVTTAGALTALQRLAADRPDHVQVRLYKSSPGEFLFHPKLSVFQAADGTGEVLVGSSNLTSGGHARNVELSAWLKLDAPSLAPWMKVHDDIAASVPQIVAISNAVIDNVAVKRRAERKVSRDSGLVVRVIEEQPEPTESPERILIRVVPRAGGRLEQVGIPAPQMIDFFGLSADSPNRQIRIQQVQPDGEVGRVEVRPLVRSEVNQNSRIEVHGVRGMVYPDDGRPLLFFKAVEEDFFRYFLLLPGDDGHAPVQAFVNAVPHTDAALPAVIATLDALLEVWPGFPL